MLNQVVTIWLGWINLLFYNVFNSTSQIVITWFNTLVSILVLSSTSTSLNIKSYLLKDISIWAGADLSSCRAPASHCGQFIVIIGGCGWQTNWRDTVTEVHRGGQFYDTIVIFSFKLIVIFTPSCTKNDQVFFMICILWSDKRKSIRSRFLLLLERDMCSEKW